MPGISGTAGIGQVLLALFEYRLLRESAFIRQKRPEVRLFLVLWGRKRAVLRKKQERNRFHGYHHPVQMASLTSRGHFALCPLLPPVSAQLPRSGGDDARAGLARRSYNDLPLSCNTLHQNWRSEALSISKRRTARGASMRPISK